MARSKRDALKRTTAQALNNMAKSILDLNSIYDEFKEVHPDKALIIGQAMIAIAQQREQVLKFVDDAWALDEDHIMHWLA